MIDKMVKPEEVLIVEDENGDIVREHVKESDVLAIYSVMRETLVFLTHLDSRTRNGSCWDAFLNNSTIVNGIEMNWTEFVGQLAAFPGRWMRKWKRVSSFKWFVIFWAFVKWEGQG